MKYKGTLIVVKDCNRALKFYSDLFGFSLEYSCAEKPPFQNAGYRRSRDGVPQIV